MSSPRLSLYAAPLRWECEKCCVANHPDALSCSNCNVSREDISRKCPSWFSPTSTLQDAQSSQKKEHNPKHWKCSTCLVQNDAKDEKCVCCETPKDVNVVQKELDKNISLSKDQLANNANLAYIQEFQINETLRPKLQIKFGITSDNDLTAHKLNNDNFVFTEATSVFSEFIDNHHVNQQQSSTNKSPPNIFEAQANQLTSLGNGNTDSKENCEIIESELSAENLNVSNKSIQENRLSINSSPTEVEKSFNFLQEPDGQKKRLRQFRNTIETPESLKRQKLERDCQLPVSTEIDEDEDLIPKPVISSKALSPIVSNNSPLYTVDAASFLEAVDDNSECTKQVVRKLETTLQEENLITPSSRNPEDTYRFSFGVTEIEEHVKPGLVSSDPLLNDSAFGKTMIATPTFGSSSHNNHPTASEHITTFKSGIVYTWGSGDCDQLAIASKHLNDVGAMPKPFAILKLKNQHVVNVASGALHTAAISTDGTLFSWGCNDDGALGRIAESTTKQRFPDPVCGLLKDKFVISVACGDSHTIALTNSGSCYLWGSYRDSSGVIGFPNFTNETAQNLEAQQPTPVYVSTLSDYTCLRIDAGENHTAALCFTNSSHDRECYLFTWGNNEFGQLGVNDLSPKVSKNSLLFPRRNSNCPFGRIVSFSCGRATTFIECRAKFQSEIAYYAVGRNGCGELGVGKILDTVHDWTEVATFRNMSILNIDSAQFASIALDSEGNVYTWGKREFLGNSNIVQQTQLMPIQNPNLKNICCVGTGSDTMFAVEKTTGNLAVWGEGQMFQVGDGKEYIEPISSPVWITVQDSFASGNILQICGGSQHSVALVSQKDFVSETRGFLERNPYLNWMYKKQETTLFSRTFGLYIWSLLSNKDMMTEELFKIRSCSKTKKLQDKEEMAKEQKEPVKKRTRKQAKFYDNYSAEKKEEKGLSRKKTSDATLPQKSKTDIQTTYRTNTTKRSNERNLTKVPEEKSEVLKTKKQSKALQLPKSQQQSKTIKPSVASPENSNHRFDPNPSNKTIRTRSVRSAGATAGASKKESPVPRQKLSKTKNDQSSSKIMQKDTKNDDAIQIKVSNSKKNSAASDNSLSKKVKGSSKDIQVEGSKLSKPAEGHESELINTLPVKSSEKKKKITEPQKNAKGIAVKDSVFKNTLKSKSRVEQTQKSKRNSSKKENLNANLIKEIVRRDYNITTRKSKRQA